jgi:hypothetical protein
VALKAVQELLGHATMEMTMRYAYLSPEVRREAVQVLDRPAPGENGAHVGHMESNRVQSSFGRILVAV